MSTKNRTKRSSCGRHVARVIARVLALATAAVSGWAMLSVRELLEDEPELDGTKLTMPILICMPVNLGFGGQAADTNVTSDETNATDTTTTAMSFDYEEHCHSMKYHLHAVTFALGLAALALIIFIVIESMARVGCGPFNRSTAAGMGLFSTFILFQAAASAGATLNEVKYWKDHYDEVVEDGWTIAGPEGSPVQITEVTLYGQGDDDLPVLMIATLALLLMTLLMFLEVMTMMCCCGGADNLENKDAEEDDAIDDFKVETPPPAVASPTQTMSPSGSASDNGEGETDERAIVAKKDNRSSFAFPAWSSYVGAGGGLREDLAE